MIFSSSTATLKITRSNLYALSGCVLTRCLVARFSRAKSVPVSMPDVTKRKVSDVGSTQRRQNSS